MRISSDSTEPWSQFSDVLKATAFEVKAPAPAGFFPGGAIGAWGRKSPSVVQGWSPGGGLVANPQKPTTGCENNA